MSETKTKSYKVVFDILSVATGETIAAPGTVPVAVSKDYYRGDLVDLSDEDAQRRLAEGSVIPADDDRAGLIRPNKNLRDQGVRRTVTPEQVAAPNAPAPGREVTATSSEFTVSPDEIRTMKVAELKDLAAKHGVEVGKGESRPDLAERLAKLAENRNPGQEQTPAEARGDYPGGVNPSNTGESTAKDDAAS